MILIHDIIIIIGSHNMFARLRDPIVWWFLCCGVSHGMQGILKTKLEPELWTQRFVFSISFCHVVPFASC